MNDDVWSRLFDRVYVVSLPSSEDRRTHAAQQLRNVGISTFEWHDALGPDSDEVARLYRDGAVAGYPPCFRCGRLACGDDSCNNVLIPVQVAVFATYRALLEKIAARDERALVMEDDVVFHDNWKHTLEAVSAEVDAGRLAFGAREPRLLRLGWALCDDHDASKPMRLTARIRMANPCFAITSAFAARARSSFERVYQTADVILHRDAPEKGQALTVLPPIASELSWSTGAVESLVHPKAIRADYLEADGDPEGASSARARLASHEAHMFHRKILVTGHPRTGTGYAASLLRRLGLDVGHEAAGRHGVSSWMFAADADRYPYAADRVAASRRTLYWEHLLHIVRDPAQAVPSIMRDDEWAIPSYEFRREHLLRETGIDLDGCASPIDKAVLSLVGWTRMILAMEPELSFRLEDATTVLPAFLRERGLIGRWHYWRSRWLDASPVNADKAYGGRKRPKPEIDAQGWASLSPEASEGLRWYCERFDYAHPGT